jgi:dynactin complex subunit
MLIEEFFELIEENKNIVDDIDEIKIIFKEELGDTNNYVFKKNNFKQMYKGKEPKYTWDKKTKTLRIKNKNKE